jgi:hypothetical protein
VAAKGGIPGIPQHIQRYLAYLVLTMMFPLLALVSEFSFTGSVSQKSAMLTASMYAIGIGVASRNVLLFVTTIVAGVCNAIAYGSAAQATQAAGNVHLGLAFLGIAAVFVFHSLERYNRHVVEREPFLDFS